MVQPINFVDYSRAPIQRSPFADILENVLKGYQMSQIPGQLERQRMGEEQANQLRAMELEHKPTEYSLGDKEKNLAIAIKNAALKQMPEKMALARQLNQARINKLSTPAKIRATGELANYMVGHPNASPEEIQKVSDALYSLHAKHVNAITGRTEDITSGSSFDKLPTNEKKREVGLMTAMGVDPLEANKLLRQGLSPTNYAEKIGVDISGVQPKYPLGDQNVKDIQRTKSYFDEMNSLEKNISEGLGKYQNKILGYSLEQISDALSGENPDKQGKALAARALLPELSSLRLKIMGGNIGIEAIRELEDKSLGKLKIIESLVDEKSYIAAQKYMTKWLEDAANKRLSSLEEFGKLGTKKSSNQVPVFNLATGQME